MDNFLENFNLMGEGLGIQFSIRSHSISTTHSPLKNIYQKTLR